jgi:putative glutamine amidotransferase
MASPVLQEKRLSATREGLAVQGTDPSDWLMPHLGSWIRESDHENFARFLAPHPEIALSNARLTTVDLSTLSGLLVTGGPDISAEFHHEPPGDVSLIRHAEPERDAWEFAAVRHAYEQGLPILAICKGVQVLNVALGGTLHLDIRGHDLPEMQLQNVQPLRFDTTTRHRFAKVNSSHHQALDRVADALEIEAWHAGDGTIEQVRLRNFPWGVGVQYHPERDWIYARLFEDFFAQLQPN